VGEDRKFKAANNIGAAWNNTGSGDNDDFISGEFDCGLLGRFPFIMFKNNYKEPGTKQPDWILKIPKKTERKPLF
jgi:uncharacterized protein (DUF736 family)